MFNTTITNHESKVVAITKEIEKTISPDKVTEMYDAVREEAEKDIVQKIFVKSNELEGVVVEFHDDFTTHTKKIYTMFTLNGKKYIDKKTEEIGHNVTQANAYQILADHYKSVVGNHLLKEYATIMVKKS